MQLNGYKYVGHERLYPQIPLILCTRFNLFSPTRGKIEGKSNPDESPYPVWEKNRIEVFRNLCLPSVAAQRVKPSRWYLLFDEVVSPAIRSLIEQLKAFDWIKPMFIERRFGFANFTQPVDAAIRRDHPDADMFVICRLDSDDSLHTHYFSILEGALAESGGVVSSPRMFNFTFGLLRENDRAHVLLNERSPFLFALQPTTSSNLLTPYLTNHKQVEASEIITERPMWCQHLHQSNIGMISSNRLLVATDFSTVEPLFGLKISQPKIAQPPRRLMGIFKRG